MADTVSLLPVVAILVVSCCVQVVTLAVLVLMMVDVRRLARETSLLTGVDDEEPDMYVYDPGFVSEEDLRP